MESPDIYNTKLGEALLRVYSQKRLHVDPDEMGIKFDQMLRRAKFNSVSTILGGIGGTLVYARRLLAKNPNRSFGPRLLTVLLGNTASFIGGSAVLRASLDKDLTINVAYKYESQITFLEPELQMIQAQHYQALGQPVPQPMPPAGIQPQFAGQGHQQPGYPQGPPGGFPQQGPPGGFPQQGYQQPGQHPQQWQHPPVQRGFQPPVQKIPPGQQPNLQQPPQQSQPYGYQQAPQQAGWQHPPQQGGNQQGTQNTWQHPPPNSTFQTPSQATWQPGQKSRNPYAQEPVWDEDEKSESNGQIQLDKPYGDPWQDSKPSQPDQDWGSSQYPDFNRDDKQKPEEKKPPSSYF